MNKLSLTAIASGLIVLASSSYPTALPRYSMLELYHGAGYLSASLCYFTIRQFDKILLLGLSQMIKYQIRR